MGQEKKNQEKKKTEKKRRGARDPSRTTDCKARRLAREAHKALRKIRQLQRRAAEGKPFRGTLGRRVRRLRLHADLCAARAKKLGYRG